MATAEDYELLRLDTHETMTSLPDPKAEAKFTQATALYGEAGAYAGARVLVLVEQWAEATDMADYTANEESEKLGQVAEAKKEYLAYWQGRLNQAIGPGQIPQGAAPFAFTLASADSRQQPLWPWVGFNQSTQTGFSRETSDS